MSFLPTAEKAARAAGAFLKSHYGKTHVVDEALLLSFSVIIQSTLC